MSARILAARIVLTRLLITASIALLAACTNEGTVNWNVQQTVESPTPSSSPAPSCPPGMIAYPVAAARGFVCGAPDATPSPAPTGPDGVDYVPYCLPTDPPGSYCQQAP